ncbi:hypothetical protein I3760_04G051400 [Carya illinoinensis]|nr:hypothetical protein I3760_04G051400 [Carya illinoinensis]
MITTSIREALLYIKAHTISSSVHVKTKSDKKGKIITYMEVEVKSVISLAFMALLMAVPLPPAWPTCGATASSLLINYDNSTAMIPACNGLADDCLAAHHDHVGLEFTMGSEITRMLASNDGQYSTQSFNNKNSVDCDRSARGRSYKPCFPSGRPIPKPVCTKGATYNRNCPQK